MTTTQDLEKEIQQLESKKALLEKKKIQDAKEERSVINRNLIGKHLKCVKRWKQRDTIGNNIVRYVKIIDFVRYSDGKLMYGEDSDYLISEGFDVNCSPVGWKLMEQGLGQKRKRLMFITNDNRVSLQIDKFWKDGKHSVSGSRYNFTNFSWKQYDAKNNSYYTGYDWYTECSESEYNDAYNDALEFANGFSEKMAKYVGKDAYTKETEEMIPELNYAVLQRIGDLVKSVDDKEVNLRQLVEQLSGKVAKWNYFKTDNTLDELAQYEKYNYGETKGINIEIIGGNEGTDYEPYITHYYVGNIQIDWAKILYPIRLKLNCKVFDLVAKLEKLSSVYNPDNWNCNYSTDSYDAVFHSVKLKDSVLNEVNSIIQSNLK